jgi:U3 small nucleolar RNA-associated protein 14
LRQRKDIRGQKVNRPAGQTGITMARRISRPASAPTPSKAGPTSSKSSKKRTKKSGIRSLNAFAIASAENPETAKIRTSRLGQREDSPGSRKRRRTDHDDDDGDADAQSDNEDAPRNKRAKKRRTNGDDDYSEGSDSEGNTWKLGHVDEDEDSDIDSDEAFDEDDEGRFAGWSFGGKQEPKKKKQSRGNPQKLKHVDINLDEEEPEDSDDGSLGADAVDLAQMLDDYEPSDEERSSDNVQPDDSSEEGESSEEEDSFSGFSDDEDEDKDSSKKDQLQKLISTLDPSAHGSKIMTLDTYDSTTPTAAGPASKEKFDISNLLNTTTDPKLVSLIKKVGTVPKESKQNLKLAPSLPKRQKDKLDRVAASKITEKTLNRWVDSVKHMRRAEHLTFPFQDPDAAPPPGSEHVLPAITSAPLNDLESTINNILQESGLGPNEDESDEADFAELPENNVSVEDILTRRAELRRARELIFQEERRAKRIKKIKSKSYRRVHRKEREHRLAAMKALENDGDSEMGSDEKEAHDRRRAEERMGAKYRESKWAKQMKKSGRTVWDDDAKSGVVEMARRNDELRKRIAGKIVDEGEASDSSSSSEDGGGDEQFKLRKLNGKLDGLVEQEEKTGLAGLKFMKKAEAAKKAENDAAIRRMRHELAGESSSEQESGDENVGRQVFDPSKIASNGTLPEKPTEFEAPDDSDVDQDVQAIVDPSYRHLEPTAALDLGQKVGKPSNKQKVNSASHTKVSLTTQTKSKSQVAGEGHSALDARDLVTVSYDTAESKPAQEHTDDDSEVSQSEILRLAFAGDDFEAQFDNEKAAVASDEDEKTLDNTMEGWGTWAGDGISKRERKRNAAIHAKFRAQNSTKVAGIRPQDRKDAKLEKVIISQKRIKNNAGYLATSLPFPFKTRAEYERSIRMPVGGEWNVVKSVQEGIKPRVIVKPGTVVEPMVKPII